VHQLVKIKKDLDNIKMHGTTTKKNSVLQLTVLAARTKQIS